MADEPSLNQGSERQDRRVGWCWGWRWGWGVFALTCSIWVLWLVGQIARDRFWLTGLCFYLPSPAVAAIGLVATLVAGVRKRRRLAIALGLMTLAPMTLVLFVENRWTRPVAAHSAHQRIRLVHWNVGYGAWGLAGIERELLSRPASIYVLSEIPRGYDPGTLATKLGPYYQGIRMGSMAVIATGRLLAPTRLVKEYGLKVNSVIWEQGGRRLKVFAVDQTSDLRFARNPLLQRQRSLMQQHRPDLLAGDLNAPRRSWALSPLPKGFRHAYDVAGRGWSYTWPSHCPLYAIDQCIVSEKIVPITYELTSNRFSDHCMQTLDFQVAAR